MTDEPIGFEVRPGESVKEALDRKMTELGITPPSAEPDSDVPAIALSKKKSTKKKGHSVTDPVGEVSPVDSAIYSAVHVYKREDIGTHEPESDGILRSNATYERSMFGPNVLVFAHMHYFGEPCTEQCRERVHKEEKQ